MNEFFEIFTLFAVLVSLSLNLIPIMISIYFESGWFLLLLFLSMPVTFFSAGKIIEALG